MPKGIFIPRSESYFGQVWVEIRKTSRPNIPVEKNRALQKRLRMVYPRVSIIRVVKMPNTIKPDGDLIHKMAGRVAARVLVDYGSTEVIYIGSGRGSFFTVSALRSRDPQSARDREIYSLCGAVYPTGVEESMSIPLDADNHAAILSTCFVGGATVVPISYAIASDPVDTSLPSTWLGSQSWPGEGKREMAIVGVGLVGPGHRFYEAVKSKDPVMRNRVLVQVFPALKKLVELVDLYADEKRNYFPVGDLAGCLFFVPPPKGIKLSEDNENKVKDLINKINAATLAVSWEQLEKIEALTVVAATPVKSRALHYILNSRLKVEVFCTDELTANGLLAQ